MAAYTQIGYSVADIAALKAIPPADRPAFAGALVSVVSTNQWFEFDPAGASGGIIPDTGSGRWYAMNREVLNANRTYFVRTDGNDNNTGLVDSAGGAFLTWQKAIDVAFSLDWGIYNVTIKAGGSGARVFTLTSGNRLVIPNAAVGAGKLILEGDTTTPTNVRFTSSESIRYLENTCNTNFIDVQGFHFVSSGVTTNTSFIVNTGTSTLTINQCDFGVMSTGTASGRAQIWVFNGVVRMLNAAISGGNSYAHVWMLRAGKFIRDGGTVTLTNTPAFSSFFYINDGATAGWFAPTNPYSGSATGRKYEITGGGIALQSTDVNYFPGNQAGTLGASPSSYYLNY